MSDLKIKELSIDDRPRERLLRDGADGLSASELLAILIGSGSAGENVVSLTRRIMASCGNRLRELSRLSLEDLQSFRGVGPAKAITIKAACQLGMMMQAEAAAERINLLSPEAVKAYFATLNDSAHEECWALYLNTRMQLIRRSQISKGGLSEASVDIRIILREALLSQAVAMILVHNHPSGHCKPSSADDRLTRRLADACKLMNIALQDHIIIGGDEFYSYRDEGRL